MNKIKEIYKYRYMLFTYIKQDLVGKYKNSILGVVWVLINPLIQFLVYFVIFNYIFKNNIKHYPVYLFIGLASWTMFQTSVKYASGTIVRNAGIVKKTYFPNEILPLSTVIGNAINYIFSFCIILIGLWISGIGFSPWILLVPFVVIIQAIFEFAISLAFSAINVFFRDIEQIVSNLLFIWMYASPIVYSASMVPNRLMWLYKLNPMFHIVEAYRSLLYYKDCFDIFALSVICIVSCILLIISFKIFDKLRKKFVEVL